MVLNIKTRSNVQDAADFIAFSISNRLKLGKKVLFLVTGGSSIAVGVKISELLRKEPEKQLLDNLTITLTDERYGQVDHADSNWRQLMDAGFNLPGAKFIPILSGDDKNATVKNFNDILNREFATAEYKIGLFGIGKDGHVAGILPQCIAVQSRELVSGYDTPSFYRITMTPRAIGKLDEAVVFAQGQNKWPAIANLEKEIDIAKQPAQILKKVPLLTIFSDYKKVR